MANNNNDPNRRGGNGGGDGNGNGQQPKQNIFIFLVAALVTLLCVSFFMSSMGQSSRKEITYNEFVDMIEKGTIESVTIESDEIDITPKVENTTDNPLLASQSTVTYYTGKIEDDDTLTQRLLKYDVTVKGSVSSSSGLILTFLLEYVLPLILFWVLLSFLFRRIGKSGGGIMGVGKSNAKEYVQKDTGITFNDVAGEEEAKESLVEIVDFLHNPQKYAGIGAKLPKGALLVGPPGTGKTLLARAVAGEAHVPFFSLSGSDFIELYVGVGASRVRDLFKEAEKSAPCIIFIDEIDAIGRSRDSQFGGGNEEREQTLNQLLSCMDGFDATKGIIVLGATNRPEILDKALLRPGRFDRRIIVDRPDLKGRLAILKVHAKDVKLDESVDLNEIALATSGAVGSDLANMINEAAINAVKNKREFVCQKDLFEAVEQVLVGKEKKDRVMSAAERRIVSYHEVGHALISAVQKNSEPVQKITIVPRTMGALGYVMQVPEEEKYLNTQAELHDMIVGYLGGRAAEELKFETVTTGAANDIEKATSIARSMVTTYGMSKKFGLMGLATVESQYLDGREHLNCSDVTAAGIDEEVRQMLENCYNEAKQILSQNLDVMDKLADYLIQKETITGKEFMKIYRQTKGIPEPAEKSDAEKLAEEVRKSAEPETKPDEKKGQMEEQQEPQPAQEVAEQQESQPDGNPSQPQQPDSSHDSRRGMFSGASKDDLGKH
ncbi:MAG: ATP-dependent zinc metalloprotease FtsH [Lachnospiraceae bacterium]|jgi:cell division protease FtsH|nr:ATP-dependent zinc metalloprotease FtsH [Lachnospiraceae bacterium]